MGRVHYWVVLQWHCHCSMNTGTHSVSEALLGHCVWNRNHEITSVSFCAVVGHCGFVKVCVYPFQRRRSLLSPFLMTFLSSLTWVFLQPPCYMFWEHERYTEGMRTLRHCLLVDHCACVQSAEVEVLFWHILVYMIIIGVLRILQNWHHGIAGGIVAT